MTTQVTRLAEQNAALSAEVERLRATHRPLQDEVATLHAVKARLAEEVRFRGRLITVSSPHCLYAKIGCAVGEEQHVGRSWGTLFFFFIFTATTWGSMDRIQQRPC